MYEAKPEGKSKVAMLRVVSQHCNMQYELTTLRAAFLDSQHRLALT
jgi:hypothetical protein